jgi:hypothetical protein
MGSTSRYATATGRRSSSAWAILRSASPQSVVMGAVYSVENEDPQPHVDFGFGFLIVNPPPVMVSTKSTSAFFRYWMLIGSTKSLTPFDVAAIGRHGSGLLGRE